MPAALVLVSLMEIKRFIESILMKVGINPPA